MIPMIPMMRAFKLLGRQGVSTNMAQYRSIAVNVAAFQWNVREAVTINVRTLRARIGVLRVPPHQYHLEGALYL